MTDPAETLLLSETKFNFAFFTLYKKTNCSTQMAKSNSVYLSIFHRFVNFPRLIECQLFPPSVASQNTYIVPEWPLFGLWYQKSAALFEILHLSNVLIRWMWIVGDFSAEVLGIGFRAAWSKAFAGSRVIFIWRCHSPKLKLFQSFWVFSFMENIPSDPPQSSSFSCVRDIKMTTRRRCHTGQKVTLISVKVHS